MRPGKPPAPRLSVLSAHPPILKAPPGRADGCGRTLSALLVHSPEPGRFGPKLGAHPFNQRRQPTGQFWGGAGQGGTLFGLCPARARSVFPGPAEAILQTGRARASTEAPIASIEGIYQMTDGERCVMIWIELLSKQVRVRVAPAHLSKVG